MVELLVATTVTLLLVVVLVQVFNGASGSWRRSEAQVDAYREARGALQLMARDLSATLQASYAQAGGGADSTSAVATGPAMPTLVLQHYNNTTPDANGPINEEVYCLTNIHNSGASTLCAVGYYCAWMADDTMFPVAGATDQRPRAFALMRQSLNSDGTFQRMQTGSNPRIFLDLFARATSPVGSTSNPPVAVSTQIAAYIWDLRFRIDTNLSENVASGGVADGNYPSAPLDHTNTHHYGGDVGSQPYPSRLPPYVEIRFKALSNSAGRRLEGVGSGVSQSTWRDSDAGFVSQGVYKQMIQPNYQQFVLRVPLLNATPLPTPTPVS